MGTWIEIQESLILCSCDYKVVPYVGTWIEMLLASVLPNSAPGRSLRGNVDRNRNDVPVFTDLAMSFPTWERG